MRRDHALVADFVTEQCHIAAIGGIDRALVDDAAGAAATEGYCIGSQSAVGHIQGGSDQPADIDLRTLAEQNAVRVNQPNLSIGVKAAEYLRAVGVEDAVDRDSGSRRLKEVYNFQWRNVEAQPVKRQVLARLLDVGGDAGLGDAAV